MFAQGRDAADLRRSSKPRAATVWGDGFHDDGLSDTWSVRSWDRCSPDEYVLMFPQLVPQGEGVPLPVLAHLETCVAVRLWRLGRHKGGDACAIAWSDGRGSDFGERCHGDWFSNDRTVTARLQRLGLLRTPAKRIEAEGAILAFLDRILFDLRDGRTPVWHKESEALFAFGAGIHPCYVWPEAQVSFERGLVAGWLGHLDRGRAALMPLIVADYLIELLDDGEEVADAQIAALAGGTANAAILLRAARRRCAGQDPEIRLTPDATCLAAMFASEPAEAWVAGVQV